MTNSGIELSPVKPGEVLGGRYRVERVLGVGGMGIVVAAKHLTLEQTVAIKFLLPQALLHPEIVTRFAREARAAVRIRSEHVSRVIDVGTLENGAPYMVMEYLEGRDLYSVLHKRGRLDVGETIDFVLQASEAVAEAHRLGIVHRDLKPANLFIVESHGVPSVKVLDFGISKTSGIGGAAEHDGGGVTLSASLLGSPAYMSPEQMTSARTVDGRSDVWALGIIMFELLAGRLPFSGDSIPEICLAITQQAPPSLRALRPDVPSSLEQVIMRCLEKQRDNRFASIDELAYALAPYAPARSRLSLERISALSSNASLKDMSSRQGTSASETIAAAPPTPAPRTAATPLNPYPSASDGSGGFTQAGWGQTASGRKSSSRKWLFVALGMALAVALGAVFVLRTPAPTAEPAKNDGAHATATGATPTNEPVRPAAEPSAAPTIPAAASAPGSEPEVTVQPTATPSAAPSAVPVAAALPAATPAARRAAAPSRKPSTASASSATPATKPPSTTPPPSKKPPSDNWEDDR